MHVILDLDDRAGEGRDEKKDEIAQIQVKPVPERPLPIFIGCSARIRVSETPFALGSRVWQRRSLL